MPAPAAEATTTRAIQTAGSWRWSGPREEKISDRVRADGMMMRGACDPWPYAQCFVSQASPLVEFQWIVAPPAVAAFVAYSATTRAERVRASAQ